MAKMFNFFGLARELRDQIYDNLLDKAASLPTMKHFTMDVKNGPHQSLMLVNRQFSSEYLEAMRRRTKIIFTDKWGKFWESVKSLQGLDLPPVLCTARFLELRIWLARDPGIDHDGEVRGPHVDMRRHLHWISHVVSLMHNPQVLVLVGLNSFSMEGTYVSESLKACNDVLGIRGFHELVVREGNPKWKKHGDDKPRIVFRYDKITKQLEGVEVTEDGEQKSERDFGFEKEEEEEEKEKENAAASHIAGTADDHGVGNDAEQNHEANGEDEEEGEGKEKAGGNDEGET